MGKTTQKDRLLSIATPLGPDYLLINKIHAEERISELFEFDVELLYDEEEDNGYELTLVDGKDIVGQTVSVSIAQEDGGKRVLTGMVNNFTLLGRNRRFTFYNATVVPHIWRLTRNFQSRIFQHKTVIEILKEVFKGFEVKYQTQRTYEPRNYCVQYQESDFAFASRIMEEEGIYYYFDHAPEMEKLVIRDDFKSPEDCPNKSDIPIVDEDLTGEIFESAIKKWQTDYNFQSGKVTLWDYHFQLPKKKLDVEKESYVNFSGNKELEVYKFPAGYARKYDDIDKSGGERSDLFKVFQDNKNTVDNRMFALDAQYKNAAGISDCCTLTPGYRFQLKNHPNKEFNAKYIVLSVRHDAEQAPDYIVGDTNPNAYINEFTCLPHGAGSPEFRPALKTPKPILHGSQTAFVVGPTGEEIFTDKYGRVKVQFHWDRQGKVNPDSSCWVRVAQAWAGNLWGTMFIPRIGMEVIVHFLEGDPDQPIITGCVYNPDAMPPYTLPDEKTKSTIKSNSSKGGGGFNEFRIEDKKGEEQIFIHGEKNIDVRIKNDSMETIKHDRHLIVENEQFEKVKKDKHLQVVGDHNEKIGGTMSLKVGADLQEKVGSNYALDAGMAVHIKAGMSAVIEAGASITLKVGGNFINIGPSGVTISGTMVLINSGGSAGSGAGSTPETPKDPKEADNAEPGAKIAQPKPPPPLNPKSYSPAAIVIKEAARNGTPFCEICNK
jgi:type VI secretion system secreted protein VgrG